GAEPAKNFTSSGTAAFNRSAAGSPSGAVGVLSAASTIAGLGLGCAEADRAGASQQPDSGSPAAGIDGRSSEPDRCLLGLLVYHYRIYFIQGLFLSTQNSCRSILAEPALPPFAPDGVQGYRSGSFPCGL